ncbi:MAG: hypothetical protein ABIQ38_02015 [Ilumatobacteraceae bacterium]
MIPRRIARRIRPLWVTAVASAAWSNRDDLRRWMKFIRLAFNQRKTRKISDLVAEVRVRAAVSANPLLRRDPALRDISVKSGVVTLLTADSEWPEPHNNQIRRLKNVKGISEVISRPE